MAQVKLNLWINRLFSPCAHSAWLFRIFVHKHKEQQLRVYIERETCIHIVHKINSVVDT
jgi:hypothetical protein